MAWLGTTGKKVSLEAFLKEEKEFDDCRNVGSQLNSLKAAKITC